MLAESTTTLKHNDCQGGERDDKKPTPLQSLCGC